MNIIEHPPLPVTGISEDELKELGMLDELERHMLGQLAKARQRRREIRGRRDACRWTAGALMACC
jgi:hypothetical protein